MTEKEDILLSDRERDVHTLKEDGHSHREIADQLGISPSTIDEYSRRIATKRERAVETLVFLNGDSPLFDPGLIEEEPAGFDWLVCRRCDRRERVGRTLSHCHNCGSQHADYNTDEWHYPASGWWSSSGRDAWCKPCLSEYFEEAKDAAIETGRIPCFHYKHSTHQVSRSAIDDCRSQYIPLTDSQLTEIRTAYRDRRHLVCPDCRTPMEELTEGQIEAGGGGLNGETYMTDGYLCDCGWKGFRHSLSFVKQ